MFGHPSWFRAKAIGWGLVPVRWQGWLYSAGWIGAIGLPFLLLVGRHQPLEAAAWLTISLGALAYDVRQILLALGGKMPRTAPAARPAATRRDDEIVFLSN